MAENGTNNGSRRWFWLLLGAGMLVLWQRRRLMQGSFNKSPNGHALVTGASSGIGAAFARQLAARGFDLILVARRTERLQWLADELRQRNGVKVEIITADLSKYEDVQRVAQAIKDEPQLDLLVSNAGFGTHELFLNAKIEHQLDMIRVHDIAGVALARAALPGMVERKHGGVIFTSSTAAFFPLYGSANYSSSKAYLNNFAETLAVELVGTGVHVQALCPGFVITEFHDETPDFRSRLPKFMWMQADDVVKQSLDALGSGEVIFVPGWIYRIAAVIGKFPVTAVLAKWGAKWFLS